MCELLAISSRVPSAVNLSLDKFAAHGSVAGPNHDGWGIAYYQSRDARLIKEAVPAASSDCVRFVESHEMLSRMVLAHIRHATRGDVSFENTQPFVRELGGRAHVFAHNGDLDLEGIDSDHRLLRRFQPMGDTDSEQAFCVLLARLGDLWDAEATPPIAERAAVVSEFAADMRELGPANFVYADGEALFAHGDRRRHCIDEPARSPGLHLLERKCRHEAKPVTGGGVDVETPDVEQTVVVVASVPLTDEAWRPLAPGQLIIAADGQVLPEADLLSESSEESAFSS